jgi:ubiquinone/menaquinone biosynthesis C-methylase UbiE
MLNVAREKLDSEVQLYQQDAGDLAFAAESFDLVTATLVLHEMDPHVRSQVLEEARRVVKTDGRILITDYHRVPLRFPEGWLIRLASTLAEISAGRRHYRNYRHFIRHGGIPELISGQGLKLEQMKITGGGNLAQFLLSRSSMK